MDEPLILLAAPAIIQRPPGAWNASKVALFKEQFFEFTRYVKINSKDEGQIILGDHIYDAQHRFLNAVWNALENDIHRIYVLKSRQLGLSTISRCLSLFWNGVHDGLKGYSVLDTDTHKEEGRLEMISMIEGLPAQLEFPRVKRQNRYLMELDNGSLINFAAAGVKTNKTSGTLGRSSGVNFAHLSELCSYSDPDSIESFDNALSDLFPNRLYVYESTARGFGLWYNLWQKAKEDPHHSATCFIGWYHKETQSIPETDPDFQRYGTQSPSAKESAMIAEVLDLYGHQITAGQLAWYRRKMDPTAKPEGEADADYSGTPVKMQEQPSTEDEAFQMTGSKFFDTENLSKIQKTEVSYKFSTYRYETGVEFTDCRIFKAHTAKDVELKVWEEPVNDAMYVIAADPAHGTNENNDRASIQVLRCYADGIDQVAEYCWPLVGTKQFGWVILSLCAWYAGATSDVYMILELQGGGESTWDEIQEVKRLINGGYLRPKAEERGLQNIFQNVRNYIYSRSDSLSAGKALQWKTVGNLKVRVMERMRDFVNNGMLVIRSHHLLEEMKTMAREGDTIEAEGSEHDDRVLAMAFGVHCWEQRARRVLVPQRRTREADAAKRRLMITDQVKLFNRSQLDSMFAIKHSRRLNEQRQMRRAKWRHGR